jgi:hypothetical protein
MATPFFMPLTAFARVLIENQSLLRSVGRGCSPVLQQSSLLTPGFSGCLLALLAEFTFNRLFIRYLNKVARCLAWNQIVMPEFAEYLLVFAGGACSMKSFCDEIAFSLGFKPS